MTWWLIVMAILLAAYGGGMVGAVLVGANRTVPTVRTVTVEHVDPDVWYPLPLTGGGRPAETK